LFFCGAGNAADAGANEKMTTKKNRTCIGCMFGNFREIFFKKRFY